MIFRVLAIFVYCLILINIPACATIKDNSQQSQFALIENKIYQNAKKNGLKKTDITIYKKQTVSGNYYAIIKCNNSKKCKKCKIVISAPRTNNNSTYFPRDNTFYIPNEIKSLFNNTGNSGLGFSRSYNSTGNSGPGFSPSPNSN